MGKRGAVRPGIGAKVLKLNNGRNISENLFSPNLNQQNIYDALNAVDPDRNLTPRRPQYQNQSRSNVNHNKNNAVRGGSDPSTSNKLPPIVIVGKSIAEVREILTKAGTKDVSMKQTRDGIKTFATTIDDFTKLKKLLLESKAQFFSHQLREEQTTKFVLHGLPKLSCDDIMAELTAKGVKPAQVREMNIKKRRDADHCVYMISFLKKDKISMIELQEIKYIVSVHIRWEYYRNTRAGPTQCNNCLRYGHGTSNCNMPPQCVRCGESHEKHKCIYLTQQTTQMDTETGDTALKIPNSKVKCALCRGDHTGNYSKCPKRLEYIAQRPTMNKRAVRERKSVAFQHAPQLDDFNFPHLPVSHATPWSSESTSRLPPRKRRKPMGESEISRSDEDLVSEPSNERSQNDSPLFTSDELFAIFLSVTSQLSKARSKAEQVQIMMNIAIKYSCPRYD